MAVDVPRVLGMTFFDPEEESLCLVAEQTPFGPGPCHNLKNERVPGISSCRCDFVGGEELAVDFCPRAVEKVSPKATPLVIG